MSLKRRNIKEDLLWLKWPLSALVFFICLAIGMWVITANYRDDMRNREFNLLSDLDILNNQVQEIELAERIIVDNIDRYNDMVSRGLLGEESRVALLDDITELRNRYNLYPVSVDIGEQGRVLVPYRTEVEDPVEQLSLRSSAVQLELPLLHEGDLTRLLEGLLASGRLLVIDSCAIRNALESEENFLTFVPHQMASCTLAWYSFRREPYMEIEQ